MEPEEKSKDQGWGPAKMGNSITALPNSILHSIENFVMFTKQTLIQKKQPLSIWFYPPNVQADSTASNLNDCQLTCTMAQEGHSAVLI